MIFRDFNKYNFNEIKTGDVVLHTPFNIVYIVLDKRISLITWLDMNMKIGKLDYHDL